MLAVATGGGGEGEKEKERGSIIYPVRPLVVSPPSFLPSYSMERNLFLYLHPLSQFTVSVFYIQFHSSLSCRKRKEETGDLSLRHMNFFASFWAKDFPHGVEKVPTFVIRSLRTEKFSA